MVYTDKYFRSNWKNFLIFTDEEGPEIILPKNTSHTQVETTHLYYALHITVFIFWKSHVWTRSGRKQAKSWYSHR